MQVLCGLQGEKKESSIQLQLVAYEWVGHTSKMSYLDSYISYFDCRTFKMVDGPLKKHEFQL